MAIVVNIPKVDKPQKHIIAYLDMLGTTAKITQDDNYLDLYRLYTIYNSAIQQRENEVLRKSRYGKIVTKIFSDNIIMAIPLNSDNEIEDIVDLISFTAFFQNYASIANCWQLRGGITIGELFIDNTMVWGKGLVRAYFLEDKMAIFPRIIFDQNVIRIIGEGNKFTRCDADGWFFLDYLNFMQFKDQHGNDNFAENVRKSFACQLKEIKNQDGTYQERPYQKLQWYKNYLNQWYNEHYTPVAGTVLIDESTFDENDSKPMQDPL